MSIETVSKVGKWVTEMVNMFGLNGTASVDSKIIGWSGISIPEDAKRYVYPASQLRDELRRKARSVEGLSGEAIKALPSFSLVKDSVSQNDTSPFAQISSNFAKDVEALISNSNATTEILKLCDRFRDVDLWNQGVYLEDRDGDQPALVRLVTKELLTLRQEKDERERQKQLTKEAREREAAAKADKGRLSHLDMFKTSEYCAWEETDGFPTHDVEGVELTKSKVKKLRKDWDRQKKLHEAWVKLQK